MDVARAARRSTAVIGAVALSAACLPGGGDEGDGSPSPSEAKGGQQLTEKEATSALPTKDQLPSELTIDDQPDTPADPEASAYPTSCLDVQLGGERGKALKDEHQKVKAHQTYAGSFGGVVSVRVSSHDVAVPGELFDDAGAAQATCAEFTKIDKAGTTKWRLEPATLPPMGDRTYAVGLEMLSGDEQFVGGMVHLAAIAVGHNLVYIVYSAGPNSQLSTETIEELAETTVKNLEEV